MRQKLVQHFPICIKEEINKSILYTDIMGIDFVFSPG